MDKETLFYNVVYHFIGEGDKFAIGDNIYRLVKSYKDEEENIHLITVWNLNKNKYEVFDISNKKGNKKIRII